MQGVLVQRANDLPIFVRLMIRKDRKNYISKKQQEALFLSGMSEDKVFIKKIDQQIYELQNEYADSWAECRNKVSKTFHRRKNKNTSGIKTHDEITELRIRGNNQ